MKDRKNAWVRIEDADEIERLKSHPKLPFVHALDEIISLGLERARENARAEAN